MDKSESITNLAGGLVVFHKECGKIKKSAANPFFKHNYAPLPTILESIAEPLEKAGLIFSQFPSGEHGLCTIIIHAETGEYMQDTFTAKPSKDDPQGIGSAITYQRRYALGAILGLITDEDDDGNAASNPGEKPAGKKYEDNDNKPWFDPKNAGHQTVLTECLKKHTGDEAVKNMYKLYKISKVNQEMIRTADKETNNFLDKNALADNKEHAGVEADLYN